MRKYLLIATMILFFVAILFQDKKNTNENLTNGNQGLVLGESEESINQILNYQTYQFNVLPKNEDVVSPIKNQEVDDYVVDSGKGAILDCGSSEIVYGSGLDEKTPIASLTKLVTALVFLEGGYDLNSDYKIRKEDRVEGGKIYLQPGDIVKVKDLLNLSLVASANSETMAMVNSTGLSMDQFVAKMNEYVQKKGWKNSSFVDPIGLGKGNISTAKEVALIANEAFLRKEIANALTMKSYRFKLKDGSDQAIYSTNVLLDQSDYPKNEGGKTGFTEAAGYCFVGKFLNHDGKEIISVILDEENINSRFSQAKKMAQWTFASFQWK